MKKYNLLSVTRLSLLTLLFGLFLVATPAAAQTAGSGQALEIAPPVMNITANPGETITREINLRDVSSGKLLVTNQVNDFMASGEDGTPKIILEEGVVNPYSLKSWISAVPSITLESKQIKKIPITITIPKNAAPGGYYGVVRFTGTPPELEGTGVSLSASLGALILLKVNGDVKESLATEEFSVNRDGQNGPIFEMAPITFVVRLKNTGNIHEQPAGQIAITDMFGKAVATVNVNLPPRDILPDSIRKFEQPLDSGVIGDKILFGLYKADLKITYGADKQVLTQSISFWVIPYRLIAAIIILVVGGITGLYYGIKRYNKFIIKKAQKPRK